ADPNLRPDEFAVRCVALCRLFQDAYGQGAKLAWESQGPGVAFGQRVTALGYRSVYMRRNEFSTLRKETDTPGWTPTTVNKRVLLEESRAALATAAVVNRSEVAVEETLNFIHSPTGSVDHAGANNRDDPTGARSNHGDRVIADALAWKMAQEM